MTDGSIVRSVVRYLGLAALLLIAINFFLLRQVIGQAAGKGTIDAATLGAISSIGTITGTVIGALGSVLVSTRSTPEPPAPVEVVNGLDDAVPVEPVEED